MKRAASLWIASEGAGGSAGASTSRVLLVLRPPDDEELPSVWGLPAASLGEGESWEDAVRRAARDKLGVDVRVGELLAEGRTERAAYTLHMRLYAASIARGEPAVPQAVAGVTQYAACEWVPAHRVADRLGEAARRGSLCSRLALERLEGGRAAG